MRLAFSTDPHPSGGQGKEKSGDRESDSVDQAVVEHVQAVSSSKDGSARAPKCAQHSSQNH